MSFVFRGTRADIDGRFPGFIPERRPVRIHAARPVNTNSMAFSLRLWLVLGVFLMATILRMYATCQQLQAQAQAHAVAASGLLGRTELQLHVPPSIAFATRGRLQGLRLQLALLDREFDELDYETLRALDSDDASAVSSMSEQEINALPVHKYMGNSLQRQVLPFDQRSLAAFFDGSLVQSASSSSPAVEKKQEPAKANGSSRAQEDEMTCTICLEQVKEGELIRSLPCLHQFHATCIDPWLRQQGTCPVCKFRATTGWQESAEGVIDASDMV
ncbi:hypothetical protein Scep_015838 [Stephania cephalantha]|uniref:RING-type E3 ubiquitin transferase n=1 Tax=Stephania cephalantha TaxID=152367 RepID=A0AAP0J657_9MAGN